MNILIADANLEIRKRIEEITKLELPEAKIVLVGDGNQALHRVIANDFDLVIISNQLRRVPGANLLQAIARCRKQPTTLLHSTKSWGYMEVAPGNMQEIDLEKYAALFEFATFKVKDAEFSYLPEFLLDFKIDRLAEGI